MRNDQRETPAKVLIADDHLQDCELLAACLADEDYQIEIIHDGQQALDSVSRAQPDLILLDTVLPSISGCEVCRRLKANPETRDISIIMVTALAEMGDIQKALDANANDFLMKPVNKLELRARVKTLLELRRLKRWRDELGS